MKGKKNHQCGESDTLQIDGGDFTEYEAHLRGSIR
jgi:hypothetical protein